MKRIVVPAGDSTINFNFAGGIPVHQFGAILGELVWELAVAHARIERLERTVQGLPKMEGEEETKTSQRANEIHREIAAAVVKALDAAK